MAAAAPLPASATASATTEGAGASSHAASAASAASKPLPVRKKVCLLYSPAYLQYSDRHPIHKGRFKLWAALANAFRIAEWPELSIVAPPGAARADQLTTFHSDDYVKAFIRADAAFTEFTRQQAITEAKVLASADASATATAASAAAATNGSNSTPATHPQPQPSCCGGGHLPNELPATVPAPTDTPPVAAPVASVFDEAAAPPAAAAPPNGIAPRTASAATSLAASASAAYRDLTASRRRDRKRKAEEAAAAGKGAVVTSGPASNGSASASPSPSAGAAAVDAAKKSKSSFAPLLSSIAGSATDEAALELSFLRTFGLVDDCALFPGVFRDVSWVSGASLYAADRIISRASDIVINWAGGRHHAQAEAASGYCYFNDIVLCIMKLLAAAEPVAPPAAAPAPAPAFRSMMQPLLSDTKSKSTASAAASTVPTSVQPRSFRRVLYVDIDIHHGDGVQHAFYWSDRVCTVSFHCRRRGFFPGTGAATEIGEGKGRYRSINVPFADGITDQQFCSVYDAVMDSVWRSYRPDAVVLQCGVDALATDSVSSFNVTTRGLGACVRRMIAMCERGTAGFADAVPLTTATASASVEPIPLILLGGGGYHPPSVARSWMHFTAIACRRSLSSSGGDDENDSNPDLPEHDQLLEYRPTFKLHTEAIASRPNSNTAASIAGLIAAVRESCDALIASSGWGHNRPKPVSATATTSPAVATPAAAPA